MHRHGYKGRKFGRKTDQREALVKGLANSLILHESIETTLDKARELRPYVEKLVTKARKGGLHNRRQVISGLQTIEAAHKLVDSIAPKIKRNGGYLRIEKSDFRRGDNAQVARISFVDDLKSAVPAKAANTATTAKTSAKAKSTAAKPKTKSSPAKKPTAKKAAPKKESKK